VDKRPRSADQEGTPPLSPAAERALLDARAQARAVRSSRIGPEHIVLGLAANPETAAGQALRSLGSGGLRAPDRAEDGPKHCIRAPAGRPGTTSTSRMPPRYCSAA